MACGEEELFIDLECGGGGGGGGDITAIALDDEGCKAGRKTWSSALSCNGIMTSLSDTESSLDVSNLSNVAFGGLELVIDKLSGGEETKEVAAVGPLEKKNPGEPRKKLNGKKSSKPPRPPKGPVLTVSDLKLVKELTELAARKRARIERIKALRKLKESKRSTSSSSSMPAMIMTALFFFILIFQGAFSGNNVRKQLVASPAPAALKERLVPFQVLNDALTNEMNRHSSLSFSTSEQPSRSSHRKEGVDAR